MASVRSAAAVDFAAPQQIPVKPKKHAPQQPKVVPKQKKSGAERMQEALHAITHSAKIMVICISLMAMMAVLIFLRAKLLTLGKEQSDLANELSVVKSDTVRLESEFNRRVAVDSVEEYARNVLGMVKRQKYQITFFKNDSSDEIHLVDSIED